MRLPELPKQHARALSPEMARPRRERRRNYNKSALQWFAYDELVPIVPRRYVAPLPSVGRRAEQEKIEVDLIWSAALRARVSTAHPRMIPSPVRMIPSPVRQGQWSTMIGSAARFWRATRLAMLRTDKRHVENSNSQRDAYTTRPAGSESGSRAAGTPPCRSRLQTRSRTAPPVMSQRRRFHLRHTLWLQPKALHHATGHDRPGKEDRTNASRRAQPRCQ
jgi:hypothetical protein